MTILTRPVASAFVAAWLCVLSFSLFPEQTGAADIFAPESPLPQDVRFDRLEIDKAARRLTAYAGGKAVRVYRIALSSAPRGHKRWQGDKKTPEGRYHVDGKNPHSAYHKNLGVSYPNKADRKAAAALGRSPGGDIKIHGLGPRFAPLGKEHWREDWTDGCIAVTDAEIDELYTRTRVGTLIDILPYPPER